MTGRLSGNLGFNEDKCKVMNIGNTALGKTVLSMKSSFGVTMVLNENFVERDLGVMLNHKLNWKDQVDHAVQRAQNALVMLKRTFKHWNARIFAKLYKAYVRPHLECRAVQGDQKKIVYFKMLIKFVIFIA